MQPEKIKDVFKKEINGLQDKYDLEYRRIIEEVGITFIETNLEILRRYSALLLDGSLTKDEFKFLLLQRKDIAEIVVIKYKGKSRAFTAELKEALVNALLRVIVRLQTAL